MTAIDRPVRSLMLVVHSEPRRTTCQYSPFLYPRRKALMFTIIPGLRGKNVEPATARTQRPVAAAKPAFPATAGPACRRPRSVADYGPDMKRFMDFSDKPLI
jgi:hypothetical protein